MSILDNDIKGLEDYIKNGKDTFVEWRHDLHSNPELAFEECRTSGFVAETLEGFGMEVHRGLAGTGVVGVLRRGNSSRMIGLRADMDALPLEELNDFAYRSHRPGVMHGCGHDGHTTMLLAAAGYLAQSGQFDGTVVFIFQPAEENCAGAGVMVREGFFSRFPIERVYGLHNRPQLPFGHFGLRPGPFMSAADNFGITIHAHGGHGGSPHLAVDGGVIAAEIIMALQTIVSRHVDPIDSAVISVTQMKAGNSDNVLADEVMLRGTARSLTVSVQDSIETMLRRMSTSIAEMHGASAEVLYERRYPALVNDPAEAHRCADIAAKVVGGDKVHLDVAPSMGSDDFSYFGRERPSAFIWLGTGPVEKGRYLHNPRYDFNDDSIPYGIEYWVRLVQSIL
jgi:hippurate hydrolase